MELNNWLALLGALGGWEAIRWLIHFYVNRKTLKKQANAEATRAELTNLNDYADSWKELYIEAKGEIKALMV